MAIDLSSLKGIRDHLAGLAPDAPLDASKVPEGLRAKISSLDGNPGTSVQDALSFIDGLIHASNDGRLGNREFNRVFGRGVTDAQGAVDAAFALGRAGGATATQETKKVDVGAIRKAIHTLASLKPDRETRTRLMDFLFRQPRDALLKLLRTFHPNRSAGDQVILQALFEQRGASRLQGEQQLMLAREYGLNTTVDNAGRLSMWPASATADTVRRALAAHKELDPAVQAYLNEYLADPTKTPGDGAFPPASLPPAQPRR